MKVSYLRSGKDKKSFRMMKGLGFDVYEIEDLEKTDETLHQLIDRQYDTIFMTNEVASFSEDLVKRLSLIHISLIKDVKGLRIGLPKEYFGEGIKEEVKEAVMKVAKQYEAMGAIVEECSIDVTEYALPVYYIIA